MTICPECNSENTIKNGKSGFSQKYKCKDCGNNFLDTPTNEVAVAAEDEVIKEEIDTVKAETTEEEVVEETKPMKKLSDIAKNMNFRKHYKDTFTETKHSKKYGFDFDSWAEYFAKKHEVTKGKGKAKVEVKEVAKTEEDVFVPAE